MRSGGMQLVTDSHIGYSNTHLDSWRGCHAVDRVDVSWPMLERAK